VQAGLAFYPVNLLRSNPRARTSEPITVMDGIANEKAPGAGLITPEAERTQEMQPLATAT